MNKITLASIAEKVNRHLDTDVRSKLRKESMFMVELFTTELLET